MTLNEYQERAMATCMATCSNFSYMALNLVGEVGEFASKVAKCIRKGIRTIEKDHLCNEAAGADLNVRTFSKERPSQRLEDMSYNELIDLYKRVRAEFERRNNEIETLIKEDMNYEHRRINEAITAEKDLK
jgi:hypothetical protein